MGSTQLGYRQKCFVEPTHFPKPDGTHTGATLWVGWLLFRSSSFGSFSCNQAWNLFVDAFLDLLQTNSASNLSWCCCIRLSNPSVSSSSALLLMLAEISTFLQSERQNGGCVGGCTVPWTRNHGVYKCKCQISKQHNTMHQFNVCLTVHW